MIIIIVGIYNDDNGIYNDKPLSPENNLNGT